MAGYGDRAASLLDSKSSTDDERGCAKSAISAISPPPETEQGRAISAISAKSTDPFARWQDGHSRIVLLEMTGGPVPEKWYTALDALDAECRAIEDERRAAPAQQAELFDAPRRWM